jgi:hypothetical protein
VSHFSSHLPLDSKFNLDEFRHIYLKS